MTGRRAVLAAGLAVAFAAAIEVGLRATVGLGDPPLYQRDPEIGYLMAADQEVHRLGQRIAINRFHQRSEALSPQPPSGVERILFVGDSITFGIAAVDQSQTFPELVAELMRADGRQSEAANASAASWAIDNQRAYVERFGTFGSDIAVLQIGSADLLQPTSTGDGVGGDPFQPDRKPFSAIGELLGRYVVPRLKDALGLADQSEREPVTLANREAQFEKNMEHFKSLVAAVKAAGTLPVVLLVPGLPELASPPEERLERYAPYRERFVTLLESLSLPLIDLAAEWEDDPDVAGYYTDGTHLTAGGNRAVAERIFLEIQALGDVRERPFPVGGAASRHPAEIGRQ